MKIMVIDGNSLVNRAFYGVRPLTTRAGLPTNAVFGFLNILNKLLDEDTPEGICVTFDVRAKTFRHEQYPDYKATRRGMPEELAVQIPLLKDVLDAMKIRRYELKGFEADDLIGTIAAQCEQAGDDCIIVTGDKDDLQLLSDKVAVKLVTTRMGQTTTTAYTPELFWEKYGFAPCRLVDLKALMGDSSDNIPGVAGVGEKTAMDLIVRFETIERIYAELPELDIKDAVRKKLAADEEKARLSYELATILRDVPFGFAAKDTARQAIDKAALRTQFDKLEFRSFLSKFDLDDIAPASAADTPPVAIPVEYIQSADDLTALITRCKTADCVSVHPLDGLDGVEIGQPGRVSVVMWSAVGLEYKAFLQTLFGAGIRKVGHHVKSLLRALLDEGIRGENFVFDTALAAYLLDPAAKEYEITELAAQYQSGQASATAAAIFALYPILANALETAGLTELLERIELPLCRVLAEMEHRGCLVDRAALRGFGDMLTTKITETEEEIFALAGQRFNISSPKQLGQVLFENLDLPATKRTKTGYSTNAEVLETLRHQHPIIPKIMEFREYTKLKGTYADGLSRALAPDGRIHSHFQMTATATGRLSSTEPNLQNIPVRRGLGGEIRKMFVAPAGWVLVDADYSQIELRILAHMSADTTMQAAFQNGEDIHTVTAAQVFDVPAEDVTSLMRRHAKAVNFGIVYGISAFSLADDIGVTNAEAKQYIDNYLNKYHGVRDYMVRTIEQAQENGLVKTLFGRIRPLPEIRAANFNQRSFGERVARNMPIQGTAADIMKLAMIHVHNRLEAEGLQARLILQVHDELLVECPEHESGQVQAILTQEMEQAATLTVPLTAEAHSGKTWYGAK